MRKHLLDDISAACPLFRDETLQFFHRARSLGRADASFLGDLAIVAAISSISFLAHLIEVALWAKLFVMCGEFQDFATAYYHSAVNYPTLGDADVIMTSSWKLLGTLEADDGALIFGVSTAVMFAVTQRLLLARFIDLKD